MFVLLICIGSVVDIVLINYVKGGKKDAGRSFVKNEHCVYKIPSLFSATERTVWYVCQCICKSEKPLFDMVILSTWRCVMIRASCIIDEPSVEALELSEG